MIIEVGITYLKMTNRSQLNPRRSDVDGLEIKRAELPLPEFNRFLYTAVGGDWYWVDRLSWTYQQWKEWVERPDMHTWIAYINGTPIGYFELDKEENYVEISKFGLVGSAIGSGLGAHLLTECVKRAWDMGPSKVQLDTCTLDHPGALHNYQSRGFKIYNTGTYTADVPGRPIGPGPDSRRTLNPDAPVASDLSR